MPTSVVTGGAGFLGSHLCGCAAREGPSRDLRRQPRDRLAGEHRAHPRRRVRLRPARPDARASRDRRAGGLRLPPREPGEPDRLPAAAAADAEGRLVRDAQRARPREVQARALPARLDERGLRRPAGAPAARDLLGPRQPDRPARRLRRGEALRRGADDGLPPPAGRRHRDRPDLQHLRPADAPPRRPGDPDLHPPGAGAEAAHRLRRRLADAELLLRRRPRPRADPARRERRAPAGEHRQPAGVHAPRARREGDRGLGRRRARSSYEALPIDDPKQRQPDITRARQLLGWEPRSSLDEGLQRLRCRVCRRSRSLSRRLLAGGGRARRDRRALRAGGERVALPPGRALRRHARSTTATPTRSSRC